VKPCLQCTHSNVEEAEFCAECGASLTALLGQYAIGSLLDSGRYRLNSELGQGGMGTVYKATDSRLNREVALKILNPDLLGHETARVRMLREAEALARIQNRNVVQIHDVFEEGCYLILVLEYIAGGTLCERMEAEAMDASEALPLMAQILDGVQGIHSAGLVHRDIKPANILLVDGGRTPKVTDLGVVHDTQKRAMTRIGTRLGTPEYMSPEQIQGLSVSTASDIYACGILLYQMLSGAVPFRGSSDYEVQHQHVAVAPDMSVFSGSVSPTVQAIITCALAKQPQDRWESASAFADALRNPTLVDLAGTMGAVDEQDQAKKQEAGADSIDLVQRLTSSKKAPVSRDFQLEVGIFGGCRLIARVTPAALDSIGHVNLPYRCAVCNQDTEHPEFPREQQTLTWINPWWALMLLYPPIFIIVGWFIKRHKVRVSYSLCAKHAKQKSKAPRMGCGSFIMGIVLMFVGAATGAPQVIGAIALLLAIVPPVIAYHRFRVIVLRSLRGDIAHFSLRTPFGMSFRE
jgi:serine/threonine protein kinase